MSSSTLMCRCGHPEDTHQHYRAGDECGVCGFTGCPTYRPGKTTINVQLTVGWVLILAFLVLFWGSVGILVWRIIQGTGA